jgi:hypothetical protein
MGNLPFRGCTHCVNCQKLEDVSKGAFSMALCWLFCLALCKKYHSIANMKTKGWCLTGRIRCTICFAVNCLLNVLFCCKQWSDLIRVKCDAGNVHFFLKAAAKFGDSLRNNERNPIRADHFRLSVLPYLCHVSSISKETFCWLFTKYGLVITYRELSGKRYFGDNERCEGHSVASTRTVKPCHILEIRKAYEKWRSAPLAVLLPGQAAGTDLLPSLLGSALRAVRL